MDSDSHGSDPLMVEASSSTSSSPAQTPSFPEEEPSAMALTTTATTCCRIQRWLAAYSAYVGSATGQDRILKFLQWSLWLLSANCRSTRPRLAATLRKLYLDVSFARYATRLTGLPSSLQAFLTDGWVVKARHQKYQTVLKWLGRLTALSMVGYHPTEFMAWLQWMVPESTRSKRSAEQWSYISCRFWLLYIVAESAQCLVQWKDLHECDDQDDDKTAKRDRQVSERSIKYQLVRTALFLLPCVTWSLPNWDVSPLVNETIVNTLSWLESVVCLQA